MAQALNHRQPRAAAAGLTPHWSWAVGAAVVLAAMAVFYVTLTDLVRESAARAPRLPPSIMPAHVQRPAPVDDEVAQVATRAAAVPAMPRVSSFGTLQARPVAHRAPVDGALVAKTERQPKQVYKCVMPDGPMYSDGPCPEGAMASSTLRLPDAVGTDTAAATATASL